MTRNQDTRPHMVASWTPGHQAPLTQNHRSWHLISDTRTLPLTLNRVLKSSDPSSLDGSHRVRSTLTGSQGHRARARTAAKGQPCGEPAAPSPQPGTAHPQHPAPLPARHPHPVPRPVLHL